MAGLVDEHRDVGEAVALVAEDFPRQRLAPCCRDGLELRQRCHPPVEVRPRLTLREPGAVSLKGLRANDQQHVEIRGFAAKSLAARTGQNESEDLRILTRFL